MRKSKFTGEQIAMALRQHETGTTVGEICRKLEISGTTFFRWQKQYGGMSVTELQLRQLREENRKLEGLIADLTSISASSRRRSGESGDVRPAALRCRAAGLTLRRDVVA